MTTRTLNVAAVDELRDGQMKEINVGESKILLARIGENYHASSSTCTHYGAPLAEGVLHDGRIICPWHHACFDARTGAMMEPPALDSLACFPVHIENDRVMVELPENPPDRATPTMVELDPASSEVAAIVGGGAAGYMAAQTLREAGYRGRIILISRDDRLPYDRPNLSKDYLHGHAEPEWMPLRPDEFFAEHAIETMLGSDVARVDISSRTITLADGRTIACERLLLATGGTPRRIDIPGAELGNVFYLRSFADADAIIQAAPEGAHAVVVGASFIGMEAAFSLKERGLHVTVVGPEAVPFSKTMGHEIGTYFQRLHESNGVEFRLGRSVVRFNGTTSVESVELDGGERLDASLVIVGIGVELATGVIDGAPLGKDGSVSVDSTLRAADGVYAAGDIASYPDPASGEPIRIEHWRTALQQGRVAARNMAGGADRFDRVPFFWTQQFDRSLRYIGHATGWDEIIWDGDVAGGEFLAFYVRNDRVVAVAGMKRDRDMAALEELMRIGRMPAPPELRTSIPSFPELLARNNNTGAAR